MGIFITYISSFGAPLFNLDIRYAAFTAPVANGAFSLLQFHRASSSIEKSLTEKS